MFAFGVGAVLPLLTLGMFSHELLLRWRKQMISAGYGAKMTLGLLFIAIGALVLSGFDKTVETALVNASPRWLTDLTTSLQSEFAAPRDASAADSTDD